MEMLGPRTRQARRRSKSAGVGEAREEEEGVRVARPRRTRSSSRRNAPEEEEGPSATPSSSPRPRRSLRRSGLNAREGKSELDEERAAAVQSAARSSSWDSRGEEQEAPSTLSRRVRGTGHRNRRGEDGEVRGSRHGRPERSPGHSGHLGREDVLAIRNAPGEDEAEARRTWTPGAKASLRKSTGEGEEEVWGTRSLRPRHGASGDAKVQGATPVSAKSSTGEREAAPEPGTRSRRARSGTSGRGTVREEEKRASGTRSRRRVASASGKCAVPGEDEDAPRTRDVKLAPGAVDELPGPSGCLGEQELVRRSPRPAPVPSGEAGHDALDTGDQRAVPRISGREETAPAASRKERGEEERREEDEDYNLLRQLLRLKDQIKQQLLEYKAEVEASKESPMEELTEGDLLQRIDDLERKMEGVKIELETKTLALKRVQVAHALQKKLEKKDSESESILAILKNILALNNSILKAQQKTRDLEEKILEVKKKRLMFKKAGEEKLLEIQAEKKKKKDELNLMKNSALLTKMKKSLQNEIDATTVIQNVFQHIIMAAKIDWAADPALKDLILQLEKNLSLI